MKRGSDSRKPIFDQKIDERFVVDWQMSAVQKNFKETTRRRGEKQRSEDQPQLAGVPM